MKLWLKPQKKDTHAKLYKLDPAERAVFDERMKKLQTPLWFSRNPRGWADGSWKAVEFKNFVLYFFPSIMIDLLPEEYYDHFMLFVRACRILSATNLPPENIAAASADLESFVKNTATLYGLNVMDFCVHSLLHLGFYAEQFGPIPNYSNFAFEGILKICKSNLHGTTKFQEQFVSLLSIFKHLSNKEDVIHIPEDHPAHAVLGKLRGYYGAGHIGDIFFDRQNVLEEEQDIREKFRLDPQFQLTCYEKFSPSSMPKFKLCSAKRASFYRGDSSWIKTTSGVIGRVQKIVKAQRGAERRVFVGFVTVDIQLHETIEEMYEVVAVDENMIWIPFEKIEQALIPINVALEQYLSEVANFV
jgi:hypothetical protein